MWLIPSRRPTPGSLSAPSAAEVTSSPHLSTFDPSERLTPTLGLVTVGPLLEGGHGRRAGVGVAVSRMGTRRCYPTQSVLVEDILLFVVFANKVVCLCTVHTKGQMSRIYVESIPERLDECTYSFLNTTRSINLSL